MKPFCIFLIIVASLVYTTVAEYTTEDCSALGLHKANLLCSSCDHLKTFDLEFLREHCTECCQKDENSFEVKRYAQARLEVCTCKFGAYPQIAAFVKSERPAKFPNLQIKYVRGLDPIIKLMDKDGNVKEVLAIDKWNTDSVDEFLKTHLETVEDGKTDYLKTNMV